ncbi:hypothetical protein RA178_03760 [Shewanella oncorhynchi]|uniref:Uncharacterized protein n=1 Tax=Shewanella oncorhynchi TaxID=2726434 RepID=A0AA50KEP5_9GAMM|nr:hypothetical protein [Shewanella oncorhynchi]WMB73753.1 hypothetical protein RA178_03760 [Shewanella oncorhynchi]
MGLPVTVYRYTDAGAPQLTNGTPSEWINILKKVLVEGYGSKSPLGWTLEFENAGVYSAVFRNSITDGGSGGYVKFYSLDGSNVAYKTIMMKCALSMTSIDTFVKPLWTRGLLSASSTKGWEVIGTSRGFYLIQHYTANLLNGLQGYGYDTQAYFIGDIESSVANDAGVFTIVSGESVSADATNSNGVTTNSGALGAQLYNTDGSNSNIMYSFTKSTFYKNSPAPNGDAELLGINHVMSPIPIIGALAQNASVESPVGRGHVPGLYTSSFAGYRTVNWPKEITQSGVVWVLLRSYNSPQQWVKTGTWYD